MLREKLEQSTTYEAYRQLTDKLTADGGTTGPNQDAALIKYTALNNHRMARIEKTVKLNDETVAVLNSLNEQYTWLVITESWCGDAAQNLPVIAAMAATNPNITLRVIERDTHLDLMDAYLTNGGRSIPKLIAFKSDTFEEAGTWGPRPATAQEMVLARKAEANPEPYDEFVKKVQIWYARDKTQSIQSEFVELANSWKEREEAVV